MDALRIRGGAPLCGELPVSGSKNASLPIIAAALLADGESVLHGVPDLVDVRTMGAVLAGMGVGVRHDAGSMFLDASTISHCEAPYELVRTMRASILVLGPLLARFGEAKVSLPGGCAIGARPIDQHLKALERMGATFEIEHGYVIARTQGAGLVGCDIVFDVPTVGGTENLMLAASLAKGVTTLRNAAREPEIIDLANALKSMGVSVEGAGSQRITIEGNAKLRPYEHRVMADRIEFGTFLVAGAMMGAPLTVTGGCADHQAALLSKLVESGAQIDVDDSSGSVTVARAEKPKSVSISTAPYPGFPTDMQAQLMAMLTVSQGTSVLSETIFENRFMHVPELDRLGARIRVDGGQAIVEGVTRLSGTTVMATDLRASACLVLAGLIADGETIVRRIYHLDRGYEHIGSKLGAVGATIERFSE